MADPVRSVGRLFVAATPIGNLEDATPRFRHVLEEVDIVLCEDTRTTAKLLMLLGIKAKRLVSYHEHNERSRSGEALKWLKEGKDLCLVSDAGSPLVSDPGYRIVRKARLEGIPVIPIPGTSSVIAGLSVSGLPTDRFLFAGFVPKKQGARKRLWEEVSTLGITTVVFVPARALVKVLSEIVDFGLAPEVCVCREMTKLHEEYLFGPIQAILEELDSRPSIKGEVTLILGAWGRDG